MMAFGKYILEKEVTYYNSEKENAYEVVDFYWMLWSGESGNGTKYQPYNIKDIYSADEIEDMAAYEPDLEFDYAYDIFIINDGNLQVARLHHAGYSEAWEELIAAGPTIDSIDNFINRI